MNRLAKILLIDDSPYICAQIEQIFADSEIILDKAYNGSEALQHITSFAPDLILLDIILPDIEGYDLYHKIKEVDRNSASIVFLTSKDQDKDIVKGYSLGACDYIKKPFHNDVLKSRILAHLQEKKMLDELRKSNEEMKANMRKLNAIAYKDSLTGLYNRRYVKEQLKQELENEKQNSALLMCDVDDFKHINDYYGHETGDAVLIGIANIMESAAKKIRVIRWGGEEFLIALFDCDKKDAYNIGEQIRKNVESFPFTCKQVPFNCTISIGITMYDIQLSFDENLKQADEALYKGKRSGKNCTIWYDGIYK